MEQALEQLLLAFAKADIERDPACKVEIEWNDIELAFELAREALPGRYMEMVRDLIEQDKDE
jgi:hypothetical protein